MPFARGIGPLELILVLVIVMLIFGVASCHRWGQAVGKAVRQFRQSQNGEFESEGAEEEKDKAQKPVA